MLKGARRIVLLRFYALGLWGVFQGDDLGRSQIIMCIFRLLPNIKGPRTMGTPKWYP